MPALTQLAKDELSHIRSRMLSSVIAEVSTMFRFAGGLQIANGKVALHAELSHPGSAKHLWDLAAQAFSVEPELLTVSSSMRQNHFLVRITRNGERVARRLGLLDTYGRPVRGLPPSIVGGSKADGAAAWRGAFLARGSLLEPGRNASLEVVCPSLESAYALGGLARRMEISYRARESRGAHRVDIREGDAIEVIVGLPLNMDGSEGGAAAKARAWARKLARRIAPVGVRMVDERLTTVAAHAALTEAGREIRRQRDIVDQAAASIILNTALETERRTGRAPGQGVGIRDGDT